MYVEMNKLRYFFYLHVRIKNERAITIHIHKTKSNLLLNKNKMVKMMFYVLNNIRFLVFSLFSDVEIDVMDFDMF